MSYLVAAIEHHARKLAQAVTRAVAEKCSGYSDYEAADFFEGTIERGKTYRVRRGELTINGKTQDADGFWVDAADALADREAEQDVAEAAEYGINKGLPLLDQCSGFPNAPIDMRDIKVGDQYCLLCGANITAVDFHACPVVAGTQTPTAGQRGESPVGDDSPTSSIGSPDPSPTIASRQHQPSVRGEGSPADSDIPPSPAGERPTWVDWATPAICDVLADHYYAPVNASSIGPQAHCACGERPYGLFEWREHVAPLIAERLDTAWRAEAEFRNPPQ